MRLVDCERGLLAARAFYDPVIYARELELVFGRCWTYLAHHSQLTEIGAFVQARSGTDNVVAVRNADGTITALLNSCIHRGHPVLCVEAGLEASFTCPYHGWTYGLNGRFQSAPPGTEPVEASALALRTMPRVETSHGFVFGSWDPDAPPLSTYLGDMDWYLESLSRSLGDDVVVLAGPHRWRVECNWKLPAENFAGDLAHAPVTHIAATAAANLSVGNPPPGVDELGRQFSSPNGHGAVFVFPNIGSFGGEGVDSAMEPYRQALSPIRWAVGRGSGTVFPNFSYFGNANTIRTWNPTGPDSIEVWSWTLGESTLTANEKTAVINGSQSAFGQGGSFQADDDQNWSRIQTVMSGAMSGEAWLQLGKRVGDLALGKYGCPGPSAEVFADLARRGFFRRWQEIIDDKPSSNEARADAYYRELGLTEGQDTGLGQSVP